METIIRTFGGERVKEYLMNFKVKEFNLLMVIIQMMMEELLKW